MNILVTGYLYTVYQKTQLEQGNTEMIYTPPSSAQALRAVSKLEDSQSNTGIIRRHPPTFSTDR